MSNDKDCLILVTGATGYIALHIIQLLQREGYRVRGTVRSLKNETKLKPFRNLCPDALYPLELVEADLTKDDGWNKAVKGCRYCIHVASPIPVAEPKNEDEIIVPAVEGTKRVLRACAKSKTLKRVVLTSSSCAVEDETVLAKGREFTEEDWTDVKSPNVVAYEKSKTLAEKAAWDFIRSLPTKRKMEMAVVNPVYVFGPSISGQTCSSLELVKRLMDGSVPLVPNLYVPMCDVRDVALAHLRAMIVPAAANNRHLIISAHMWWVDIACILRKEFGPRGYSISTYSVPNFLMRLCSIVDRSARVILPRLGKVYTYSDRRMREVLKIMEPYSARDTLVDTVQGLIESGALKTK